MFLSTIQQPFESISRATWPGVWSRRGASPPGTSLSTLPRLCSTLSSGSRSASSATCSTVSSECSERLWVIAIGSWPNAARNAVGSISSSLVISPPELCPQCDDSACGLLRESAERTSRGHQQCCDLASVGPQPVDHVVAAVGARIAPCRRARVEDLDVLEL